MGEELATLHPPSEWTEMIFLSKKGSSNACIIYGLTFIDAESIAIYIWTNAYNEVHLIAMGHRIK